MLDSGPELALGRGGGLREGGPYIAYTPTRYGVPETEDLTLPRPKPHTGLGIFFEQDSPEFRPSSGKRPTSPVWTDLERQGILPTRSSAAGSKRPFSDDDDNKADAGRLRACPHPGLR